MRWETLLVILADASITHWPNAELCSSKRNGDENLSLDGLVWSGATFAFMQAWFSTVYSAWTTGETIGLFVLTIVLFALPYVSDRLSRILPARYKWQSTTMFGFTKRSTGIICMLSLLSFHLLEYATDLRIKAKPKLQFVFIERTDFDQDEFLDITNNGRGKIQKHGLPIFIGIKNVSSTVVEGVGVKVTKTFLGQKDEIDQITDRPLYLMDDGATTKVSINPWETKFYVVASYDLAKSAVFIKGLWQYTEEQGNSVELSVSGNTSPMTSAKFRIVGTKDRFGFAPNAGTTKCHKRNNGVQKEADSQPEPLILYLLCFSNYRMRLPLPRIGLQGSDVLPEN